MPISRKDAETSLQRKGFMQLSGDHNFFVYHTLDGKKTAVRTKTSHSHRDLSDGLLAVMARQCRLSNSQFKDLVHCPLSREAYEQELRVKNLV